MQRLKQLGCGDSVDINFPIEIKAGVFYKPIMLAAVLGNKNVIKLLLENPLLQVNVQDKKSGVNAFWLAAYYGKGHCLQQLADAGADVYCKHKITKSNALHVAIANQHYSVAI